MAEADKIKAINQFTKFLTRIANDLKSRKEEIPISLKRLYVYCDKWVARNKGQITQFKRYYKLCKDKLSEMSEGGYLYFTDNKYYKPLKIETKEQFFQKMEQMARQIILQYWPPQEGLIDDPDMLVDALLHQFEAVKQQLLHVKSTHQAKQIIDDFQSKGVRPFLIFQTAFSAEEVLRILQKYVKPRFRDNKGDLHDLNMQFLKIEKDNKDIEIHPEYYNKYGYHTLAPPLYQALQPIKITCQNNKSVKATICTDYVALINKRTNELLNLAEIYIDKLRTHKKEECLAKWTDYKIIWMPNDSELRNWISNVIKNMYFRERVIDEYKIRGSDTLHIYFDINLRSDDVVRIFQEFSEQSDQPVNREFYSWCEFACNNEHIQIRIIITAGKLYISQILEL